MTILVNWGLKQLQPVWTVNQRKNRVVKCERPGEQESEAALLRAEGCLVHLVLREVF